MVGREGGREGSLCFFGFYSLVGVVVGGGGGVWVVLVSLCSQARREHLIPWAAITGSFAGLPACYVGSRIPTLALMIVQQAF